MGSLGICQIEDARWRGRAENTFTVVITYKSGKLQTSEVFMQFHQRRLGSSRTSPAPSPCLSLDMVLYSAIRTDQKRLSADSGAR